MRSGTELDQFLWVFLPTLQYLVYALGTGSITTTSDSSTVGTLIV